MSDTDSDSDFADGAIGWEQNIKQNFAELQFNESLKNIDFEGRWLYWPELCEMSPARMISFLKNKEETAFIASKIIVSFGDDKIPQSYLHWWCHTYFLIINGFNQGVYPVLGEALKYNYISHWNQLERQETSAEANVESKYPSESYHDESADSEIELIAILELWLEILFLDISLRDDEEMRKKVPRLKKNGDQIVWHDRPDPKPPRKYATRLETLKFILRLGSKIFSERGYVEGVQYWDEICKKFSILG